MTHKCYIIYRRADGLPQDDGKLIGKTFCIEDSGRSTLSECLRALQNQGQYIVGVSFVCERPNSDCPC